DARLEPAFDDLVGSRLIEATLFRTRGHERDTARQSARQDGQTKSVSGNHFHLPGAGKPTRTPPFVSVANDMIGQQPGLPGRAPSGTADAELRDHRVDERCGRTL